MAVDLIQHERQILPRLVFCRFPVQQVRIIDLGIPSIFFSRRKQLYARATSAAPKPLPSFLPEDDTPRTQEAGRHLDRQRSVQIRERRHRADLPLAPSRLEYCYCRLFKFAKGVIGLTFHLLRVV